MNCSTAKSSTRSARAQIVIESWRRHFNTNRPHDTDGKSHLNYFAEMHRTAAVGLNLVEQVARWKEAHLELSATRFRTSAEARFSGRRAPSGEMGVVQRPL